MRKVTILTMLLALACVTAFAQQRAGTAVTLPAGVTAEEYTLNITYSISQQNGFVDSSKEFTALVAFDGNDVYISGLAYYFQSAYVKGTLANGKVTFASGQFVGSDMYGDEYLSSYTLSSDDTPIISDFTFNYDALTRTLAFDGQTVVAETPEPNGGGLFAYIKSAVYTPGAVIRPNPVEVPENLETTVCLLIGTYVVNEPDENGEFQITTEKYQRPVTVGYDGDDLYIQGLAENVPEAWAKATKNAAGQYVIPKGQYLGTIILYGNTYDYYIASVTRTNSLDDVRLTYNAEDGSLSTTQTIVLNGSEKTLAAYYWIKDFTIKPIAEKEATPANPELSFHAEKSPYGSTTWYYASIFVPLVDTNGDPMAADKLSYMFYRKKDGETAPVTFRKSQYYMLEEDMTEIPFGFSDKLDIGLYFVYFEKQGISELQSWSDLGMQSIYRGNGVEHRSDITWFDLAAFWQSSGISTPRNDNGGRTGTVYNLSGQRVDNPKKGLYIVNGKKVVVR